MQSRPPTGVPHSHLGPTIGSVMLAISNSWQSTPRGRWIWIRRIRPYESGRATGSITRSPMSRRLSHQVDQSTLKPEPGGSLSTART